MIIDMDFTKSHVEILNGIEDSNKERTGTEGNNPRVIIKNLVAHPMVPAAKVFFIQDPPHIFKCIRNQNFDPQNCSGKGNTNNNRNKMYYTKL